MAAMSGQDRKDAFQLQPLLYPALPHDASVNPASPAALNKGLRCAEPYGPHLYLGSSDGQVHCFIQPPVDSRDEASSSSSSGFRHVGTRVISNKPVEKIIIISKLGIAAVLSEATLTFHELPGFLPVPAQVLPHTKGVASVVLDDDEVNQSWSEGGGLDSEGLVNLCIIRRKVIMLVKVGVDTWRTIKEFPLPGGAIVARRFGSSLCISTTTAYSMIDLNAATMSDIGLPITQTGEAPSASNRPSIVSVSREKRKCDFVITSHSQTSTLGVFVSQQGEPTASLLEWPSHPRALALDHPYIYALLRNNSIEIHNVNTMEKVQTLHLPQLLEPRTLSLATSTLVMTESGSQSQMSLVHVCLKKHGGRSRVAPTQSSWRQKALLERRTKSRVLLVGKNAVQCLCSSRVLDKARMALEKGDYARVKRIANQAWEEQGKADEVNGEESVELEYIDQMIALHCLRMLQFEEARTYIARSRLDPRIILHLFPTLFADVSDEEPEVEIFADVNQGLTVLGDLEKLPSENLHLNYSPLLDVSTSEVLQDLKGKLSARIHGLLRNLLDDYRSQGVADNAMACLLDTCLAKVFIAGGKKEELAQLLHGKNECDMRVLEPYLEEMACFAAIAMLRQERHDWKGTFEVFTRLLDGEIHDATFAGSLHDIVRMLEQCQDADLVHQYALWLVQRDAEAGIKLLLRDKSVTPRNSLSTLEELRGIDDRVADAFLEFTALSKKHQTAEAHMELANVLINRLSSALSQAEERTLMEQVSQEFTLGGYAESFVAHMALRCDETSTIVQRLKLIMLLQGSNLLDVESILRRVEEQPLLIFERAILLGKLQRDTDALELFAVKLRDTNSSEIYCNQNRFALSSVQLQSLAVDQKELILYANFYAKSLKRSATIKDKKVKLFKVLLQVYLEKGVGNEFQVATSHLLNTQSLNLSPLEVLNFVSPLWSLSTLNTFLSRSLRKEMHKSNEGQIKRSVALAQNLEVSEILWAKRRGMGGVIEDGTEEELYQQQEADTDAGEEIDEGRVLIEKALQDEKQIPPDVYEVRKEKEM
ncbi:hypothetical protein CBS101457_004767 [Exobasidium rhododendri]|nr:hypothetical protein CBS101457_004767 [Exobasidium rhododendri]